MPRTNLCTPKEDSRIGEVVFWIFGIQQKRRMQDAELAKRTGINVNTIRKRRAHPETMRMSELWKLVDVLKPPEDFRSKII